MKKVRLGRTELMVTRTSFGALPIQRVPLKEAGYILRKAYDNGVNYFDTAHGYSDSEEKIGYALSDVRDKIIISTKSPATNRKTLLEHVELSLKRMKTDYIDILQLHNPAVLPDPNDPESSYAGMVEARERGLVRFISVTNHKIDNAIEAVNSDLYDTLQFPLNYLSSKKELNLIELCKKKDIGLIAMKALSGGLLTNIPAIFAFFRQFDNTVPIWGIQREKELDEFLELEKNPVFMNDELKAAIDKDIKELSGSFCRGCGYCMPCPVGIPINMAARMYLLVTRSPYKAYLQDSWKEKMELIEDCLNCGQCKSRCPYELDTPNLLKSELEKYRNFYEEHKAEIL